MWFRSIFLKTVREGWVAILGWGLGMGLLVFAVEASVGSVISAPGAREQLASIAASMSWAASPVAVTSVGGYTTWKLGFTILVMAIWPLIASSRILRGAEEVGSMDVLLSAPRSRVRVALESLAGTWTILLGMAIVAALVAFAGGASAHADFSFADALLFGLNLALICGVFGSIALFISQFTQRRSTAAGATGGLLFFFIVLDMVHRVVPDTRSLSAISPVYYYNLSKPLVPSFGTDGWALLVLFVISVVLSAAAVAIFARRDVALSARLSRGSRARKRSESSAALLPERSWWVRSIYARALAQAAMSTVWWTIGMASFTAFSILATHQIAGKLQKVIADSPAFGSVLTNLSGAGSGADTVILGALFVFLPLLIMAFGVTQATRWASDEEEGRQELILTTPRPRLQVLLARFAAVATAAVFIALVTLAVAEWVSESVGLPLGAGHLAAATLSIIPQCLLTAAIGYLFAGWLRTALETGALSFVLVIWFFISFVGPELGWSKGVLMLSAFYYYGAPLVHGLPLGDTLIVLGAAAALLALASLRYVRKDIRA